MNSLLRNAKYIIVRNERRILILLADKVILGFRNIKKCQVFSKKHKRFGFMTLLQCEKKPLYRICNTQGSRIVKRNPRILSIENLVHCISCRRCPLLHIGETAGRNLRSRSGEHLRSIHNNTPGFPVAQHFNSTGQSISDVQVRGVALCSGINIQRKQREMRLIFQLVTVQPKGLNIIFSFA